MNSTNSLIMMIVSAIDVIDPIIRTRKNIEKETSIEVLRLFYDNEKPWRLGGKNPEEGWVAFHPNGDITIATLWDTSKKFGKYNRVLSILQPELRGYSRCAEGGKYHTISALQTNIDGKQSKLTRWTKHIAIAGKPCDGWYQTLRDYLYAMKLG